MHELHDAIPDPQILLALEPEELGAKILFLLRERFERDRELINVGNCLNEILNAGDLSSGFEGYPQEVRESVVQAVSEAFAWIIAQGLIVDNRGNSGWYSLSRRARKFEREEDLFQYALAQMLPRQILHQTLSESIWMSFVRGDFDVAVFHAMKQVEVAVREAAGFKAGDHGVSMIRRAFHKDNGPLSDPNQEEAERDALQHLFAGAIGSYKNPHSHRNVPLDDPAETAEIILLANHLLRIVEARSKLRAEAGH